MKGKNTGGCGGLVLAFISLAAFFVYVSGLIIVFDVVIAGIFISSLNLYNNLKGAIPSLMICPNCGSNHVMLSTRKAGTSTDARYSQGYYNRESVIRYDRIANCQACGFVWDYITQEDIIRAQEDARGKVIFYGIVLAGCVIFTLKTFGLKFISQVFM